ncbi:hypothetical protein IW261DRAFT_1423006 [Armillaria novae-zelandiae]|uniref:Uncharacterized protein n=1 Tax=Armillaria novae-zelandiae TaxID=153914 RepID=A0AA39NYW2_9AGAR|nr:hypothetical protein IW261DRAFT_1423006 [Armillaria novae-zelandiae]
MSHFPLFLSIFCLLSLSRSPSCWVFTTWRRGPRTHLPKMQIGDDYVGLRVGSASEAVVNDRFKTQEVDKSVFNNLLASNQSCNIQLFKCCQSEQMTGKKKKAVVLIRSEEAENPVLPGYKRGDASL